MHARIRIYVGHAVAGDPTKIDAHVVAKAIGAIDAHVSGWTALDGRGRWQGQDEPSTVFELLLTPEGYVPSGSDPSTPAEYLAAARRTAARIARDVHRDTAQSSVLFTAELVDVGYVS